MLIDCPDSIQMDCDGGIVIPPFGFKKIEKLACILMAVAGMAGLILMLTGSIDWVFTAFEEKWASAHVSSFWLVLQSLVVIAGGIGAWRSSFVVAGIGVASSLIARTAVGHITFFPGLLMFLLLIGRFISFRRYQREGLRPLPPETWRR